MLLNRKQILAAKLPFRDVSVPEWGGDVRVQAYSIKTRLALLDTVIENERAVSAYEADQAKDEPEGLEKVERLDQVAIQLIHSIVTLQGDPLFTIEDYEAFKGLPYNTLERLYQACVDLSINPTTVEAEKKSSARTRND